MHRKWEMEKRREGKECLVMKHREKLNEGKRKGRGREEGRGHVRGKCFIMSKGKEEGRGKR